MLERMDSKKFNAIQNEADIRSSEFILGLYKEYPPKL